MADRRDDPDQSLRNLVRRFCGDGLTSEALRETGRPPELIVAESEADVTGAVRRVLHRLRVDEAVAPWDICVLSGVSLEDSAVWKHRRFGNEALWNGQVDDAGHTLGLASSRVPAPPDDVILCDSIRRFKGLERPVVVLVELRADDPRLDRLLYIGASRARQHLMVVAPAAILEHLR